MSDTLNDESAGWLILSLGFQADSKLLTWQILDESDVFFSQVLPEHSGYKNAF